MATICTNKEKEKKVTKRQKKDGKKRHQEKCRNIDDNLKQEKQYKLCINE